MHKYISSCRQRRRGYVDAYKSPPTTTTHYAVFRNRRPHHAQRSHRLLRQHILQAAAVLPAMRRRRAARSEFPGASASHLLRVADGHLHAVQFLHDRRVRHNDASEMPDRHRAGTAGIGQIPDDHLVCERHVRADRVSAHDLRAQSVARVARVRGFAALGGGERHCWAECLFIYRGLM